MLLEFLNLGTPEIILILISLLFFVAFIVGIVLLVKSLFKQREVVTYNFQMPASDTNLKKEDVSQKKKTNLSNIGKIALPQQSEIRYANIAEIVRCEADDNYTNFILTTERIMVSKSLKEYADALKPIGFIRTHQSHLVNPLFVKSWLKEDGGTLLLANGDKIPVSKVNREMVKEQLAHK